MYPNWKIIIIKLNTQIQSNRAMAIHTGMVNIYESHEIKNVTNMFL